ncbi:FAD/FMN-containing dehydrogenase [Nocardia tenerifensis]|uniref:FAD/FMN-containing dehydrogenase n=1 Tax=Nocardia tenerifensis TaxID=228006 RepID=A0A318KVE6_9NOCA|nr:FAD-binding oxidoreductase [Nocardia tenerifensis]PXX68711.1 FAD/FMN-containing dehydrogenase [Nocardia tenerifensis]
MAFEELRAALPGRVQLPGDAGFDEAIRPWSLAVHQPVAAVAHAEDAGDVAAVVAFAAKSGVQVVTQPTGHSAAGGVEEAILLRTGRLDGVSIDAERRVARVGAGANWGQVQAAAGAHGLTGLAGSNPVVGVTGYTLGGGLSWFSRKYGWASDAVRAFEIVDATGAEAVVTASSDPELFWALRGGGGDFAVVTAMEFELFPAPAVYGGRMMWPGTRTRAVFEAFQEITASAPAELTVWFHRFQFPDAPPMVALDAAYLGDAEAGRELLAGWDAIEGAMVDKRGALSAGSLGDITAEPTDPSPALSRGELLSDLGDAVVKTLVDEPVSPLVNIQIRHLGGALTEAGAEAGARGSVDEPYLMYAIGLGLPHLADAVKARNVEIVDAIGGHVGGLKPYTFLSPGESASAAFDEATLARLRDIKRSRDPKSVIRANYPVLG